MTVQRHLDTKGRPVGKRVASDEVATQGPGRWVEFRARLKLKHLRSLMAMASILSDVEGMEPGRALEAFGQMGEVLAQVVLAWNWVDEEGEALAQPKRNAEVFEELDFGELNWLIEQLGAHVRRVQGGKRPPPLTPPPKPGEGGDK